MKLASLVVLSFFTAFPALSQERSFRFSIDQDRVSGAPDFSFLNHPLEPSDRVVVKAGHFFTLAGQRVRFFGVNCAFGANFPEEENARRIARRLRRLGINLVRLHHMDSRPDRDPVTAGSILTTGPYPTFNPIAIARLRVFLDALKAEGIYVNLNLHVGYEFRPDVDQVPAIPGGHLPAQSKPLHIFYPRMQQLQAEYARQLVAVLKLKNDPVLAMVEIDNEISLIDSWQRNQLDRDVTGPYREEFDRQKREFLNGRADSVDETIRFLADRDRAYFKRMLGAIREATDAQLPVAGTQMSYGGFLNLDSHQDLDYQDNHFYIDHYNFPHTAWDTRDWRQRNTTSSGTGFATFLNVAATRQAGRPFTVSEFNQPYPNAYAAEINPALAAFAAFQDWDALIYFAWEHGRDWNRGAPSGFNLNGDWTKWPNVGQSAWIFRTAAVSPGKQLIRISMPPDARMEATRQKVNGNAARFLKASAGYDANAAFVHRIAIDTAASDPLPADAKSLPAPYTADTGEISFDPSRRVLTVDAPQAAGVFGFAGKQKVAAGPVTLTLAGPGEFVTFLLTALDGKPLRQSARIFLTVPGAAVREGQKLVNYPGTTDWWTLTPDPKVPGKPSGVFSGSGAVLMERVDCIVTLQSAATAMIVYPLDGSGNRKDPLPSTDVKKENGVYGIHLYGDAPWYELVAQ